MLNREQFAKVTKVAVRHMLEKVSPNGILPTGFLYEWDDQLRFVPIPIEAFDDPTPLLAMHRTIVDKTITRVACIQPGTLALDEDKVRFSEEMLLVHVIEDQGELVLAPVIDRHIDSAPTIHHWVESPWTNGDEIFDHGTMISSFAPIFRHAVRGVELQK